VAVGVGGSRPLVRLFVYLASFLDEDRSNNRLDNLIWLCHNCHYLIHHHDDEREGLMAVLG
jgi:hypothetical protein